MKTDFLRIPKSRFYSKNTFFFFFKELFLLSTGIFAPEKRQGLQGNVVFSTKEAILVKRTHLR